MSAKIKLQNQISQDNELCARVPSNKDTKTTPAPKYFNLYGKKQTYIYKSFGYTNDGYVKSYVYHALREFGELKKSQAAIAKELGVSLRTAKRIFSKLSERSLEKFHEKYGIQAHSAGLWIDSEVVRHFGLTFAAIEARGAYLEKSDHPPASGNALAKEIGVSIKQIEKIKKRYIEFFDATKGNYSISYEKLANFIDAKSFDGTMVPKCGEEWCQNAGRNGAKMRGTYIEERISLKNRKNDTLSRGNPKDEKKDSLSPQILSIDHQEKKSFKGGGLVSNLVSTIRAVRPDIKITLTREKARFLAKMFKECYSNYEFFEMVVKKMRNDVSFEEMLNFKVFGPVIESIERDNSKRSELKNTPHTEADISQMIETLDESKEVKHVRRSIAREVGWHQYFSWFHQAIFGKKEGKILITPPNLFVQNKWKELFPMISQEVRI